MHTCIYGKISLTLNPRNPTNRKATTNQIQEIRTFFRLGLGKKTRIHALWGLAPFKFAKKNPARAMPEKFNSI